MKKHLLLLQIREVLFQYFRKVRVKKWKLEIYEKPSTSNSLKVFVLASKCSLGYYMGILICVSIVYGFISKFEMRIFLEAW